MGGDNLNICRDNYGREKLVIGLWHKHGVRLLVYAFVMYGAMFAVVGLTTGGDCNVWLK